MLQENKTKTYQFEFDLNKPVFEIEGVLTENSKVKTSGVKTAGIILQE